MSSSRFQSQVFFMDGTIHSGGQRESLSQLSSPVPHDGDSSKLKWHKSGIACPSMSFIRRHTEDTTMLHEWQALRVVHRRWHPLHNGVAVPNEKRVLSKSVPRHPLSITGVELGAVHLVHAASQIWTHGDVHSQGPCIIMLCSNMAVSNTV